MIYLDYAATTPLDKEVLNKMTPYMTEAFGNASSQHAYGRTAANAVISARDKIAEIMGVGADGVYFTSGGTEAANTALKGVCLANSNKGRHIVLSAIEHPALIESAKDMVSLGFEVTLVNPSSDGIVSPESIERAIRPDTVFVGVMSANNEVGTIQPIKEIYDVVRRHGAFFYCDCVQTAGVLQFSQFPADGVGISAHKFYGPKGVGALFINPSFKFRRLISGGSQERGLRGGTTFTAGAVGCAYALERACTEAKKNNAHCARLRDELIKKVEHNIDGVQVNGDLKNRLASNANLSFDGCDGEQILFNLDMQGIAVSTGSACSSGAVTSSHVLTAMGLDEKRVRGAVRFSLGKYTTEKEVDATVSALVSVVKRIRG